jgi:uncharacterized protein YkwD
MTWRHRAILLAFAALAAGAAISTSARAQDLNSFRAAHGRPPLAADGSLAAMAYSHSVDMARRGRLDHAGFRQQRGPGGARAENVAYGCADAACTMRMWIRSAGHRANMLRRDVSRYGLASAVSAKGRRYWTLVLGP